MSRGQFTKKFISYQKGDRIVTILDSLKREQIQDFKEDKTTKNTGEKLSFNWLKRLIPKY